MHNRPHTRRPEAFALLLCLCALISSCSEQRLQPDDVEYRKDDNGTQFLYQIGADEPFGTGKRAFVEEYYPSSKSDSFWKGAQQHFEVGFLDGKRDGNFTFWQKNGIKLLTGAYKNGFRDGKFIAYGKTGELVYEKTFKNGELDGNFTMYYPASNNDVFRYKEKLAEEDKDPGELTVKNHLRLKVAFSEGNPVGPYEAYFHPGDQNSSQDELLMEKGHFSRTTYHPRPHSLAVILPDGKRPFPPHPPTPEGFSRAIGEAAQAIRNIPAYTNPKNHPAFVYTLDDQGGLILPIWSSQIVRIGILSETEPLRKDSTYLPTYKSFVDAQKKAKDSMKSNVQVVGLDIQNNVIDILWAVDELEGVIPLPDKIVKRQIKTKAGVLEKEQITFYPQTNSLVVVLPDKKRPFPSHKPTPNGFSRAIDEAAKAIKNIPAYRNPDNAPALVYTLDAKGEEIMPIWSSHIQKISIRKGNGFLMNETFEPNYESFEKAQKIAEGIEEPSVEVVGLDKKGQIIDIFWSENKLKGVTPLSDRINKHWIKTKRSWDKGYASDALWLLSNGSQISIRESIHQ